MQFYSLVCDFLRKFYMLPLISAPLLLLLFAIYSRIKKSAQAYFAAEKIIHILFLAIFIMAYGSEKGIVALCALIICGKAIYRIIKPHKKREKKKKDPVGDFIKEYFEEEKAEEEKSQPENKGKRKITAGNGGLASGEEVYFLDREKISLNHAIGVAEKLKRARLTVADRLEADNIYRTLLSYRAKNILTREEKSALNSYLSTLLKFMAKYSL